MDAVTRFAELVRAPTTPLDEAALTIASCARPGEVDIADVLARLDVIADECPERSLEGLRHHLFVELGFHGNLDDYYDPGNSYLDLVLERRTGIPITLSIVLAEVGRRIGVPLTLVGMPGHVVAKPLEEADRFVDAFHGGAMLDAAGCLRVLEGLRGPINDFDPNWLAPMGPRAVLLRMLANLKAIAMQRGERSMLTWVQRLRCAVPGIGDEERRELARLLAPLN